MADERSVLDIVQDVLRNLQGLVRSEIRLAKVEIREDVRRTVSSGIWLAAGIVAALSAWSLLLWTLAYALATRMAMWSATLVVAVAIGAAAAVLLGVGMARARRIQPMPERTVESVRETLEWMKQPTR